MTDVSLAEKLAALAQELTLQSIDGKASNLDIALSALRDALRGTGSKTLTDIVNAIAGLISYGLDGNGIKRALLTDSAGAIVVGGRSAVGSVPTAAPVGVSGVDGSGLKRALLTDATGRVSTILPDGLSFAGSVTSADVIASVDMLNYNSVSLSVTSAGSGCTIIYEYSNNNSSWNTAFGWATNGIALSVAAAITSSTTATSITFPRFGRYFRARVSVYGSGTVTIAGFASSSPFVPAQVVVAAGPYQEGSSSVPNPIMMGLESRTVTKSLVTNAQVTKAIGTIDGRLVVRPHTIAENEWSYAAASGGLLNTAVPLVFKASAGATARNYLTSGQISAEPLGTATELTIENGDGTVLWRIKIPTGGLPVTPLLLGNPLRGLVNSSLQIRTNPATVTGAIYFNAQGYIGP